MNKTISIFLSFESHKIPIIDLHPKQLEEEKYNKNKVNFYLIDYLHSRILACVVCKARIALGTS